MMARNDYDRVANQIQDALRVLLGSTHGPLPDTDSVSTTKDGWINAVVGMQRAIDYCRGLAIMSAMESYDDDDTPP